MRKPRRSQQYYLALELKQNGFPQPKISDDQIWYINRNRMFCTGILGNRAAFAHCQKDNSSRSSTTFVDVYRKSDIVYVPKSEEVLRELGAKYSLTCKGRFYNCTDKKGNTYKGYSALKATTKAYVIEHQNNTAT